MKRGKSLLLVAVLTAALTGCTIQPSATSKERLREPEQTEQTATIFAMDTIMDIKLYGGTSSILKQVEDKIKSLENKFSTTNPSSDIAVLNKKGENVVSEDTAILLGKALEFCNKTEGALDISIYPIVRAWGFTVGEYTVPDEKKIQQLLSAVDYHRIQQNGLNVKLVQDMEIDLGSVAKGYTGDELAVMLKSAGVKSALLNLGGNVHTLGTKPDGRQWKVAIQDPKGDRPLGVVEVSDEAVVTSGGYERYFEDDKGNLYWHIMDPATGHPADSGLSSVTIVSSSGVYADALSTALFIKGMNKAVEFWKANRDFEAVFIDKNEQVYITEGLNNRFFLADQISNQTVEVIKGQ